MARISEFTQRVMLDRSNPGNIESAMAVGGGNQARSLLQKSQTIQESSQRVGANVDELTRQRDAQGKLKAQEQFNEFQRRKTTYLQEQKAARMSQPDGFAKTQDTWHLDETNTIEDALAAQEDDTPFDMSYFRQLMDNDRTSDFQQNTDWENGMRVQNITVGAEQNIDQMNVNFSLGRPRMGDLPKQLESIREYNNNVGANILSPEQNQQLFKYGADQATGAVMTSMLEDDPRSLNYVMNYGRGGRDAMIDFVALEVEGGDKVVSDGNVGGIAKYGIYSEANKGVDVKNLTLDGAREIYKTKYWDPKLEKYEPAFQAVAFDALVNHGNDKDTWAMINQAKGDPYSLIALRQEYYQLLIARDPAEAKNAKGWQRRMSVVTDYVRTLDGGGRDFLNHAALLDPDMINRTKNLLPEAISAKDRQEKAEQDQLISEFNTNFKDLYSTMTTNLEPIGADELNNLKTMAMQTGDPEVIEQAQAMENMRPYVNSLKGMGEDQLRKTIRAASAEVNKNPNADTRLALEIAESVLANQIAAVEKEGLAYYGRIDQIRMPSPINYADPRAAMNELRSREDSSLNVFTRTGKLMPVLTPDEVKDLQDKFNTMPSNEMSGLLSTFDDLDQASKINLAQEIAPKSAILATAISVNDLDVRRRILQGAKIEPKYPKADMQTMVAAVLDPMVVDPEFSQQASEAVMAYYNSVSSEQRDFSEDIVESRINDAIESIYGPMVDVAFSGTNKVFSFKDPDTEKFVPEDDIYDMFNALEDGQLVKLFGELPKDAMQGTVTADDIKDSGRIVSAGDGLYNVVFDGIGGLYDKSGNLVEIDGRELLALWRKGKKK